MEYSSAVRDLSVDTVNFGVSFFGASFLWCKHTGTVDHPKARGQSSLFVDCEVGPPDLNHF
jgi:hypothetical protein